MKQPECAMARGVRDTHSTMKVDVMHGVFADLQAHETALKDLIDSPAVTTDGVLIKLCANIGKSADAVTAVSLNADGVGLYRTEFVFLVQDHFPSEEEQYRMYRTTADRLKPREVVIRVLDIGSDKCESADAMTISL